MARSGAAQPQGISSEKRNNRAEGRHTEETTNTTPPRDSKAEASRQKRELSKDSPALFGKVASLSRTYVIIVQKS